MKRGPPLAGAFSFKKNLSQWRFGLDKMLLILFYQTKNDRKIARFQH